MSGNSMKGYKQTEIGVIPEDWELPDLESLCSKLNVGFVGVCEPYFTDEVNGILLIRTGNLQGNNLILEGARFVTKDFHQRNQKSKVIEGDILIARHGSSGNAVIVPKIVQEANTLNIVVLRSDDKKVYKYYLAHVINSESVRSQAINSTAGSTQGVINTGEIAKLKIPLPPTKSEQTAIATALSDADALISSLEKLIEKKRAIKQGAMQELLKPKEGWEVKKLGEIFSITAGGDLDTDNFSSFYDEKYCYPIYSNSLSDKGLYGYSSMFTSEKDTITVTARGTVGYANSRDHRYTAIGRVLILNPIQKLDCFFISELINNRIVFANESTGVPQLTAPQISKYEISIPSFEEQTRITTILSDMDAEITALEQKLAKYKQIKQGMMQELLTGRIRLVENV